MIQIDEIKVPYSGADIVSTNVSLTPEIEEYAQSQVASGFYKSISEFIRESIRLHRTREQFYIQELTKELSLAGDQIDNGQTNRHDMQSIMSEVLTERNTEK